MIRAKLLTSVAPNVQRFTEDAIERAWQKLIGEPMECSVVYTDFLSNKDTTAEYNPDTDTIVFAMRRIDTQLGELETEAKMVLFAAHEATHKAQFHRGEQPVPTHRNWNYENDPHEEEAWRVALEVFKDIYPKAFGWFEHCGNRYDLSDAVATQA